MKKLLLGNDIIDLYIDDGIIVAKFKVREFNLESAKIGVSSRLEASNNVAYPMLLDGRNVKSITKEARDYLASAEGSSLLLATALVSNSVLGKFIANFFLQVNKPKIPLKFFTDEDEAMKWLIQYKSTN